MTNAVQQLSAEQIETQQLSAAASAVFRQPIEKFIFTKRPSTQKTQKHHIKIAKKSKRRRQRRQRH